MVTMKIRFFKRVFVYAHVAASILLVIWDEFVFPWPRYTTHILETWQVVNGTFRKLNTGKAETIHTH